MNINLKKIVLFLMFFKISPQELDSIIDILINQRKYSDISTNSRKKHLWSKQLKKDQNIVGRYSWAGNEAHGDEDEDYVSMLNYSIRNNPKYKNHEQNFGGNADFELTIDSNPIDSKKWMDQFWEYFKKIPANQIIFPGTHDSLTGYSKVKNILNFSNDKSKTQENLTFTEQLDIGVRFFDIRFVNRPFWYPGSENIENMLGVHSGVVFDINVKDFIAELKNYFSDNKNDIIFITLSLSESSSIFGNSKTSDDKRWDEFIDYAISQGLENKIIKNNGINPSNNLEDFRRNGNIIIQSNNSKYNGKYKKYFWSSPEGPGEPDKNWGKEGTPQEWFREILRMGYDRYPLSSNKVFNYLPMTQTGYDGQKTWKLNGVLSDWILFANQDIPEDERPVSFINKDEKFALPYKKYTCEDGTLKSMQNFNLVNVDYVDRSAFVLNCITQNLIVSKKF